MKELLEWLESMKEEARKKSTTSGSSNLYYDGKYSGYNDVVLKLQTMPNSTPNDAVSDTTAAP